MELAGNEKRIRALFSELSHEEAQAAPRFEKLWREAQPAKQPLRFSKSLVVIAASLLVAVAVTFAAWSSYKSPAEQNAQTAASQMVVSRPAPDAREPEKPAFVRPEKRLHSSRQRSLARQRQSERALQQQAAMLATWKSPTANFMTSPTSSTFNSLPQLNESVKQLQSFLPKESNQ